MADYQTASAVTNKDGPAKQRYIDLEKVREPFLMRARECSVYTIPTLVPPQGANANTKYSTPYQSLGARGVNNLAAKLLLALFPPNSPFFRLAIDDYALEALTQREGARAEAEKALSKMERAVMVDIETTPTRAPQFEGLKHLLVAGNVLEYLQPKGGIKVFRLDQYVVKRDPAGNVLEIITKECMTPLELPEAYRAYLVGDTPPDKAKSTDDTVEVYTWVRRAGDGWVIHQECNGKTVPGTQGKYPLDKSPWLPLRYISISGEDYGRGFVEEYLGDLLSLEGLSKAIVQASAAAAKILFLVKPNSTTSPKDLSSKESGEFARGNAEDVTVLQLEKYNDFKVALEMISRIEERLSLAFLLNTAVQRDAERVTAEEIRYMAQELETALGGVYSTLAQELQLPYVTRKLHTLPNLPKLPNGTVKPMITTGIEAIGRGNDLTRLSGLLADIAPLGPEVIAQYLNVGDFISRCATARGIDQDGLVNSEETVKANQQQAQMQALIEKLGPNFINQAGGVMQQQMSQQTGA
jgi:hypothetical protein